MNNQKHTPGPWKVYRYGKAALLRLAVGQANPPCNRITDVSAIGRSVEESRANANLIAAAPDLLAICQALHTHVNGINATMRATNRDYANSTLCVALSELIRDNAAAIAKAEGDTAASKIDRNN